MKKIGLLTFCDTTNFGSWLQTYALYKKIKDLGYEIEVIRYICDGIELREKLTIKKLKSLPIESIILQVKKQLCFSIYTLMNMKISKKYRRDDIYKTNKKYVNFLLGSDLVWDLNITYGDTTYLFDFLEDDKVRFAYAASSGRDYIPDSQREIFTKCLKKFNYITVRESGMVSDIENISGCSVYNVCDPTLLIEGSEWKKFVNKDNCNGKYVLLYFVDGHGNLSRIAKKYARENGLELLAINRDFNIDVDNQINPISISEFLSYIYYAEKIFTASYHGMMFSIIFNKQFAFYPFAPATRMLSVAKRFDVENMNIESNSFDVNQHIDYKLVNNRVYDFREESIKHLNNMLSEMRK